MNIKTVNIQDGPVALRFDGLSRRSAEVLSLMGTSWEAGVILKGGESVHNMLLVQLKKIVPWVAVIISSTECRMEAVYQPGNAPGKPGDVLNFY